MSTVNGSEIPPPPPEHGLRDLLLREPSSADPKDQQIAELQDEIQAVQEKASEERFLWVLVFVVLVDIMVLGSMGNWSAPIVIGIIQLIGIVIWADRCGVNAVAPLVDRLSGVVRGAAGRQSGS
jgi:hypothetical protein